MKNTDVMAAPLRMKNGLLWDKIQNNNQFSSQQLLVDGDVYLGSSFGRMKIPTFMQKNIIPTFYCFKWQ